MAKKQVIDLSKFNFWDEEESPKERHFPQIPLGGIKPESESERLKHPQQISALQNPSERKPIIPLSNVDKGYRDLVRRVERDYIKVQINITEICLKDYQKLIGLRKRELPHAKRRKKDITYCYLAQKEEQLERQIGILERRLEIYQE